MHEYTSPPHLHRLVGTVFYEETSPLEQVVDVELGLRVSEMIDFLEDEDTIVWWFRFGQATRRTR